MNQDFSVSEIKHFFAHYDYAENIYNELKNTDAECIWTDGCFDIFKDYQ